MKHLHTIIPALCLALVACTDTPEPATRRLVVEGRFDSDGYPDVIVTLSLPADGSAREQAASCQKVLGGDANICYEYATKRYRSNCINWGIVPFTIDKDTAFDYVPGDYVFVPGIRKAMLDGKEEIMAKVITGDGKIKDLKLYFKNLPPVERQILADGCLMNYYANQNKK